MLIVVVSQLQVSSRFLTWVNACLVVFQECLKCESASRHFQPGEGPNRGLLYKCEIFVILRLKLYSIYLPADELGCVPLAELHGAAARPELEVSAHCHAQADHLLGGVQAEVVADHAGPGPVVPRRHARDAQLAHRGVTCVDM